MTTRNTLSAAAAILACAMPAWAATPVQLQFEGLTINKAGVRNDVRVSDFYNGGTSKTIPDLNPAVTGPSLGVTTRGDLATASETAAQANPAGGTGVNPIVPYERSLKLKAGGDPILSTELGWGFMFVQGDPPGQGSASAAFDFAGGFAEGVSFFYSSQFAVVAELLDGKRRDPQFPNVEIDNVVDTLNMSPIAACAGGATSTFTRCEWAEVFIAGPGTGIRFTGPTSGFFIDNLTFGSLSARTLADGGGEQPAPEPSTYALMALGLAGIALTARRRQRRA